MGVPRFLLAIKWMKSCVPHTQAGGDRRRSDRALPRRLPCNPTAWLSRRSWQSASASHSQADEVGEGGERGRDGAWDLVVAEVPGSSGGAEQREARVTRGGAAARNVGQAGVERATAVSVLLVGRSRGKHSPTMPNSVLCDPAGRDSGRANGLGASLQRKSRRELQEQRTPMQSAESTWRAGR